MSNDNTTPSQSDETLDETEPQGETPTTPTGETPESTSEPSTPSQTSLDDIRKEVERLKASLKRANAEAKTSREQAAELAKFKEQTEAEKLSDQQKQELARQNLEKQLAEKQSQMTELERVTQERIINLEVRLQATAMGVEPRHLDKMARLLDWSEIEYDDSGTPTNVKTLLDVLHKDMPELFVRKAAPTSGGATNPPRSQTSTPQTLSWEVIGKLTPAQYEARRAEIQQWMGDPKNFQQKRF